MKQLLERTKLTSQMLENVLGDRTSDADAHLPAPEGLPNSTQRFIAGNDADFDQVPERRPTCSQFTDTLRSALGQSLAQILKRPEISIEQLAPALREFAPDFFARSTNHQPPTTNHLSSEVRNELKALETEIKYAGYLDQQQRAIDRLKKAEQRRIPEWFDYRAVSGLSREMQEKLGHVTPQTLGQASRIPGVTPAAVSLINVYIEIQARRREQAAAF
jgi:tRNA uridine 5-carboxymethylaminomethyl modification enzyme